jgi:hypothetical protein
MEIEMVVVLLFMIVIILFFIFKAIGTGNSKSGKASNSMSNLATRTLALQDAVTTLFKEDPRNSIEKPCPRCAELVKGGALVCRFCGHEFDPASVILAKSVILQSAGNKKINVIKLVLTEFGVGLKEAKDLVGAAPIALIKNTSPENAQRLKILFEQSGATIDIV